MLAAPRLCMGQLWACAPGQHPPPLPRFPSLSMARNAWERPIIFPSQSTTTCVLFLPLSA